MADNIYSVVRQQREDIDRAELEMLRQLTEAWTPTLRWLEKRIRDITAIITEAHEAGQGVSISYIYARDRYRTMMEEAKQAVEQYNRAAYGIISGAEADAVDIGVHNAEELVNIAEPANPMWTRINKREVRIMTGMLSENSPLAELLSKSWPEMEQGIKNALLAGIGTGQGVDWIAREMMKAVEIAPERAMLIARTEVIRAYRQANLETMRSSRAVTGYRRLCYAPTACFACLMMDGEYYDKMEDFSDHPNGKCTAVPVTRHYDPADESDWQKGKDWFMAQTEQTQRSILGPGHYELWKNNGVDPRGMVYIKQNDLWGGSPTMYSLRYLREKYNIANL